MQINEGENLVPSWVVWQFMEMPKVLFGIWKNYILFALNYFSLPHLLKSFFAPWHKYRWNYPKAFDVGEFFSTLVSNAFSRVIGAFIRLGLIVIGIIFQIFVVVAGLAAILFWVLVPLIIVAGIFFIWFL